ncbi:MAG: redox-regulated ATPase YchF [Candidatus Margulisiibacteriota bacterium]
MSFSLGIIGLPNVGKSTLFNVLSRAGANVSNYPFCTIDPNIGVVEVPDERLIQVQKIIGSKVALPTVIEFYDIAGLVKGAHKGEGLGNQFLSHIRETAAVLQVVRCFADPSIIHVEGAVDPKRDIELINAELILSDLATIAKKFEGVKSAIKAGDKKILQYMHLLEKIKNELDRGIPARVPLASISHEDCELLTDLSLLTAKPVLYVANVDETGNPDQVREIEQIAKQEGAGVVALCAKLENEIAELPPADAQAYLKEVGLDEAGLSRVIHAGYKLLDLITFFTANTKEARAWAIKRGTTVVNAAGKVHSDMGKGFISAEVIHYKDLIALGSYAGAREKGLLHTEGKTYVVQDGDLILVRFVV